MRLIKETLKPITLNNVYLHSLKSKMERNKKSIKRNKKKKRFATAYINYNELRSSTLDVVSSFISHYSWLQKHIQQGVLNAKFPLQYSS